MKKYKYICESCGRVEIYDSPEKAYNEGWDYPPFMGQYGILSPRTCQYCTIDKTVWWKLQHSDDLNQHDIEVIERIKKEPECIEVEVDE